MRNITAIFDNGGETLDRYTFVYADKHPASEYYDMLATCETGRAFSQHTQGEYTPDEDNSHLGKQITWDDVPSVLRTHVRERLAA